MDLRTAQQNLAIFENAGNKKLNLDMDHEGKITVVSEKNLLGRLWKWIRNLNGSVTKKVDETIRQSIYTLYWECKDDIELNALIEKDRKIEQLRPNVKFNMPTVAPWNVKLD